MEKKLLSSIETAFARWKARLLNYNDPYRYLTYSDYDARVSFHAALMSKEKILCSAIWYKDVLGCQHNPINIKSGTVVCGHRHHSIIASMSALLGVRTAGRIYEQGFLTDKNRFVDREEAFMIASLAGQLKNPIVRDRRLLHSEDLY